MALEQNYYEMLARTDHPVFKRDFSSVTDVNSPFNSIMNRLFAKQLKLLQDDIDLVHQNSYPHLATELSINQWEETFFGFTKPDLDLATRIEQLLIKINKRFKMNVDDVIAAARSITGVTPIVIRNLYFGGWVLDVSALDVDSVLSGSSQSADSGWYLVIFSEPVSSFLLQKLDEELTKIEKGGSRHIIQAVPNFWVLGVNTLDVDTILG